eukprot:1590154-Prymnesium_polylepis.1
MWPPGSEQSRWPRRVRTMGATVSNWPDTAIDLGGRSAWPRPGFRAGRGGRCPLTPKALDAT